jgi:ribosomal protein S18 acetylase RimI-like enzyme
MIQRDATAADAADLAALGQAAFRASFAHLYSEQDLAAFLAASHAPETVAAEIADPGMRVRLVTAHDGTLLGFCKLVMACGWPEYARASNVLELKQLYTAPDATSRGIGAALMDWALLEAKAWGAGEMQLSVYSENVRAQQFYARYGFEKQADIHFMVGEQRDPEFLVAKLL